MKKISLVFILFSQIAVFSQFSPDLVLQLYQGTQAEMNTMSNPLDMGKILYNTTDDKIYYYDATNWVLLGEETQDISGSSLSAAGVLTIGITNGNNETVDLTPLKDNLGNHIATTNINLNGNYLSGDGDNEGVFVDNDGNVGMGTATPGVKLEVVGKEQNTNARVSVSSNTALTTSSKTFIDVPGLTLDITTADSHLLILLDIPGISNDSNDEEMFFIILVDDVQVPGMIDHEESVADLLWSSSLRLLTPVSAGTHTVKVQWRQQGWQNAHVGSLNPGFSTNQFPRVLTAIEF